MSDELELFEYVALQDLNEKILTPKGELIINAREKESVKLPEAVAREYLKQHKIVSREDIDFKYICLQCETKYKTIEPRCTCGRDNIVPLELWRLTFNADGKRTNSLAAYIATHTKYFKQLKQEDDAIYTLGIDYKGKLYELKLKNSELLTSKRFCELCILHFHLPLSLKQKDWALLLSAWFQHPQFNSIEDTSTTDMLMREEIIAAIEDAYPTKSLDAAVREENRYCLDDYGNILYASRHLERRRNIHTTIEKIRSVVDDYIAEKPRRLYTEGRQRARFWIFNANKLDLKHKTEYIDEDDASD